MLKSTGMVRKTDELGRVVIPIEIRRTMNIETKDPLEIYTSGEYIVLQKYQPACIFCGEAGEIINYQGKNICKICLVELASDTNVVCINRTVSFW
ncbi:MAG: AbrB/MazE/SpoVT family DNA-binding domain-containing protein [Syntrophomonadaceae bacterium]|nr:AbrB/MazE/SpoVT family DNA-binding domain-containing protein [Syntrophomonadaceae bacterium]